MAKAIFKTIQNLTGNHTLKIIDFQNIRNLSCQIWQGRRDTWLWGSWHTVSGYLWHLKAHSLIFALSNKDIVLTESKYVPHLCHNICCFKLEHLSYEPHSIKNQRLVCKNESEYCGLHDHGHCFIQVSGKV